ncbi:MAG TPA: hypothetical protein VKR82_07550 [Candidatus Acidoferrales bacterium]|jgi:hypothetical protein|nr:hypothetical protein [Candidatus Acidoferrales bacterium]
MRESRIQIKGITICGIAAVAFLFAFPVFGKQPLQDSATASPARADVKALDSVTNKDSKDPKSAEDPKPDPVRKNDRIFGVIPNHNTVEGAQEIKPISSKEKFKLAAESTLDPYSFLIAGILAGEGQATNDEPTWGRGFVGFTKRYGASVADQTVGPLMTTGLFPSLFHQDPRYFQLGHGGFKHRFNYALVRLFVTRTDSGNRQFNYSEFVGNAAAAGISNVYYPKADRTLEHNLDEYATQVAVDLLGNELKEFWPDIRRKVFHKK